MSEERILEVLQQHGRAIDAAVKYTGEVRCRVDGADLRLDEHRRGLCDHADRLDNLAERLLALENLAIDARLSRLEQGEVACRHSHIRFKNGVPTCIKCGEPTNFIPTPPPVPVEGEREAHAYAELAERQEIDRLRCRVTDTESKCEALQARHAAVVDAAQAVCEASSLPEIMGARIALRRTLAQEQSDD